ncbi:HAD family hydrolase, partial [Actinoallomurus acaciae]
TGHVVLHLWPVEKQAIRPPTSPGRSTSYFTAIVGRTDPDPRLLKPHPELINRAVKGVTADPAECVLIGDSLSDIEGARNAGTFSIGYANKPGKHERFITAGADAIISDMAELLPHLSEHQAADPNAADRRRRR